MSTIAASLARLAQASAQKRHWNLSSDGSSVLIGNSLFPINEAGINAFIATHQGKSVGTQEITDAEAAQLKPAEVPFEVRMARLGVPSSYCNVPFVSRYLEALQAGRGLWLWGAAGVGKTFKACSVLASWISSGAGKAAFATAPGMLRELRAAIGEGHEGAVAGHYALVPLLVLDDLGRALPTELAITQLFEVINARSAYGLPTIVTSQESPSDMAKALSSRGATAGADAIVSRLVGSCEVIHMTGADRRLVANR